MDYQDCENAGRKLFEEDFGDVYTITYTSGIFDRTDFTATATTDPTRTYVGDIKAYTDPLHPRPYTKFPNYQIDYDKLEEIESRARDTSALPLLVVYFSDCLMIWRLDEFNWREGADYRWVNKDGRRYGMEKEWRLQAFLDESQAKYVDKYDEVRNNTGVCR